jgi:hypothetical protein
MTRRLGIVFFGGAVALLLTAATAWACTNLATLNLGKAAGEAGSQVKVTGSAFAADAQAVQFHWNGENGEVLAKAKPNDAGNVSATVEIPSDARPGYNVLIATQSAEDGPAFGTPARASFLVGSATPSSDAPPSGAPSAVVGDGGTSTGLVALTGGLGVLGIVLFGAGLSLFTRELRRRSAPAPVRNE